VPYPESAVAPEVKLAQSAMSAAPLALSKRMDIEQAFQAIAFNCLDQIEANAAGIAQKYHAESLHQMRVGLRRLRCAIKLFGKLLMAPDFLQQELDWLSRQLGAARDWDVLSTSTLPSVINAVPAMSVDKDELQPLVLAVLSEVHDMRKAASAAVKSKRYALLIIFCHTWIQGCEWRDTMTMKEQNHLTRAIAPFADDTLQRQQRRLRKRAGQWQDKKPKLLHKIRLATKKMRYAAMFFYSLCPPKKMKPYLAELSLLQEELGWSNDVEVAHQLLKELRNEDSRLISSTRLLLARMDLMPHIDTKKTRDVLKKMMKYNIH
jgi:triphosphatase